jgi:hypothetical protein
MQFTESLIRHIEHKLPKEFLPDHTTGEKVLIILDVWQSMRDKIADQDKKLEGAMKDLEFTLNLLNIAETYITDNDTFKQEVNDWLEYYRKISKQEK